MKTDHVVKCKEFVFALYGDRRHGYYLEVWDRSGEIAERLDIPLVLLAEALTELGLEIRTLPRPEIRPQTLSNDPEGKNRPKPA